MVNGYLSGDSSFEEKIALKRTQIEDDIKAVDTVDRELGVTLETTKQRTALKEKWQTLKGKALSLI